MYGSPCIGTGTNVGYGTDRGAYPYTGGAPTVVSDVSGVAALPANSAVKLTSAVVTVASGLWSGGYTYVEDTSRAAGILVQDLSGATLNEGDIVSVEGTKTIDSDGEPVISGAVTVITTPSTPLKPLGMPGKAVIGKGIDDMGILATSWGKVTYVNPSGTYLCIDDGSGLTNGDGNGDTGLAVNLSMLATAPALSSLPAVGKYVSAAGVVGLSNLGGGVVPVLNLRKITDIQVY